jgi:hypothetical protein
VDEVHFPERLSSASSVSSVVESSARIFLLSPANCKGRRAKQVLASRAGSALAVGLRSRRGVPLGDLFAFMSSLYFRGKLTYARRFAVPPEGRETIPGVHVITATAGLRTPETRVTRAAVRAFAGGDIDPANPLYRRPLEKSAHALAERIGDRCEVVLLGSIASSKYVDVLLDVFGERLQFPAEFVGRGDMSRGGLLLRHAAEGAELDYLPLSGAVRRGARPPKLPPLCRVR